MTGVNIMPCHFPLAEHLPGSHSLYDLCTFLSNHFFVSSHPGLVPLKSLENIKQEIEHYWRANPSRVQEAGCLVVLTLTSMGFHIEQSMGMSGSLHKMGACALWTRFQLHSHVLVGLDHQAISCSQAFYKILDLYLSSTLWTPKLP